MKIIASLTVLASLMLAFTAAAQVTPGQSGAFTNLPAVIPAGAYSNQVSRLTLRQNTGLALEALGNTSSGVTNVVYVLRFSTDGTNDQTTPINWVVPATGSSNYVAVTNWSAAQLAGFTSLNLTAITNQNGGTFTNLGVNWSRWNPPANY